eukprot:TRINITY_DN60665_c0_g1_i1.p1 TRINITY_DN60665_c0_g1~~TRINITY_DN60665_c0_g1_i1.p1  ORF type:complete len:828 (-),score=158.19 TRINITY_DN60665_c0_g1_i1:241-2724(-)
MLRACEDISCTSLVPRKSPQALQTNSAPLGALQRQPCGATNSSEAADSWSREAECRDLSKELGALLELRAGAKWRSLSDLPPSGLDGSAVRAWLTGQASGFLCLVRLLDSLREPLPNKDDIPATTELQALAEEHKRSGVTGKPADDDHAYLPLDVLLGGFPVETLLDGNRQLVEHMRSVLGCGGVAVIKEALQLFGQGRGRTEKARRQSVSASFTKARLEAHPRRKGGNFPQYFKIHFLLEALKQWQELDAASPLANTVAADTGTLSADQLLKGARGDRSQANGEAAALSSAEGNEVWVRAHLKQLASQQLRLGPQLAKLRQTGAYGLLGVSPQASASEVVKAYRAQARRLHPDRGGAQSSKEAFQELRAAYELVLSSGEQRGSVVNGGSARCDVDEHARSCGARCDLDVAERSLELADECSEGLELRGPQPTCPATSGEPKATVGLSFEAVAVHVKMALELAEMCANLASLTSTKASIKSVATPCRRSLGREQMAVVQVTGMAGEVSRVVGIAGGGVVEVPKTILPLLQAVSEHCLRIADEDGGALRQDTRALMTLLQDISTKGLHAASLARDLSQHVASVSAESMDDLAAKVREAAEAAAVAAFAVAEAELRAEWLTAALKEAAAKGRGSARGGEASVDSPDADAEADASNEDVQTSKEAEEGEGGEQGCRVLELRNLHKELADMQFELRAFALKTPALLSTVSIAVKEQVFLLVREVLSRIALSVQEALARGSPQSAESALLPIFAAFSWRLVAIPSLEARLLRLAACFDAAAVCGLLESQVFRPFRLLPRGQASVGGPASKNSTGALRERCAAILQEVWPPSS